MSIFLGPLFLAHLCLAHYFQLTLMYAILCLPFTLSVFFFNICAKFRTWQDLRKMCHFQTGIFQFLFSLDFFMNLFFFLFRCDYASLFYIWGRVCPSVGPSVRCYFRTTNLAIFRSNKSSNVMIINDITRDNEVIASDVPRGTCFFSSQFPAVSPKKNCLLTRLWLETSKKPFYQARGWWTGWWTGCQASRHW